MDSMVSEGDDGLPVYDRPYNASDLRGVMRHLVSDGVCGGFGDELAVSISGGSWYVGTGAAVTSGLLIDNEEAVKVLDSYDISTGEYAYIIVAGRFDSTYRDGAIYAKVTNNTDFEPERTESVWELVLGRVDWLGNLIDFRMNGEMCGMMAAELGADVYAAKRAGLLHDIGKAVDHEMEGTHVALGVEFLRKYHEKDDIIHAVQAHHNDVEPQTIVACLVQAADAISAARPGARRENLENYIKRLEQLEEITGSYPGVDKAYAIQAGREVRVMVKPDQVSEDQMVILARELAKKIEEEMEYPGQIKVHVLRETTAIEYAK